MKRGTLNLLAQRSIVALISFGLTAGCSKSPSDDTFSAETTTEGSPSNAIGNNGNSAESSCDPSDCSSKGGKCIDDGVSVACRLTCSSQVGEVGCPFNYHCVTASPESYCAPDAHPIGQRKDKGQWGSFCMPSHGGIKNTDCDGDQGFRCQATSPTDANAYCTQFDCTDDNECAGGYYCGTVNELPNANGPNPKTTKGPMRSFGKTRRVCLQRVDCAPCESDVDCLSPDGVTRHCIADLKGTAGGKFCASVCDKSSTCALESTCSTVATVGGQQVDACVPKAGSCKGDGSLCSPCRSDADCPSGFCITNTYSSEKFCSVKSKSACTYDEGTGKITKDCPTKNEANAKVTCSFDDSPIFPGSDVPKDQCVGLRQFSTDNSNNPMYIPACYTADRK